MADLCGTRQRQDADGQRHLHCNRADGVHRIIGERIRRDKVRRFADLEKRPEDQAGR